MKRILYIAGIVIIVVVVGALLINRADETEAPTVPSEPSVPTGATQVDDSGQFLQVVPTEIGVPPSDGGTAGGVPDTLPPGADAEAPSATGETVTIEIDDSGFAPTDVTISVGTTVTFVNNGQALHWPASDVHPTHEILPDFDSNRGLQTGESYSHTFIEAGSWDFHDHLRPSFSGTITVTE